MTTSVSTARVRAIAGGLAAILLTTLGTTTATAAAGTRDVVVDGIVVVLAGDDDGGALPDVVAADVAGTLVTIPTSLAAGLRRDLPVALTLTAPEALTDAQAVVAAGDADASVSVAGVSPIGSAPIHEFVNQDGARTLTVVRPTPMHSSPAMRFEITAAIEAWQTISGGALAITPQIVTPPAAMTGTCDPSTLLNRALAAAGLERPAGRDLVLVSVQVACPWRSYAALGGTVLIVNERSTDNGYAAHGIGHLLGLDDVDVPWDLMSATRHAADVSGTDPLDAALAGALGWFHAVELPTAAPWAAYVRPAGVVETSGLQAAQGVAIPDPDRGTVYAQWFRTWNIPSSLRLLDLTVNDGIASATLVTSLGGGTQTELPAYVVGAGGGTPSAGQIGVTVVPTGIDATPPSAAVVQVPAGGWMADAPSTVSWTPAVDDGVGVFVYAVLVDGVEQARAGSTRSTASVPTPSKGPHTVVVTAVDAAGNAASSAPAVISFGTPDDRLAIVSPTASAYVRNPVTIAWRTGVAMTTPVAAYKISTDDGLVRVVPGTVHSIQVPLFHGWHSLAVTAVGADGKEITQRYITMTGDTAPEALFTDVTRRSPFVREIFWLAAADITHGFGDGSFRPGATIARDAMAAFLYRFPSLTARPTAAPTTAPFRDVPVGHQFGREIAWLKDAGITTGFPDGRFRGEAPVSREAMAAFLFRYAGVDESYQPPAVSPFTDVSTSDTLYREIAWLSETGVTTGYPDGSFHPGEPVTREAMAAFLYRLNRLSPATYPGLGEVGRRPPVGQAGLEPATEGL